MKYLIPFAACANLLIAASAHAENYVFTHTGFAGGASITGSFSTGAEVNGDTFFSTQNAGEITAFEMTFSGNADVARFTANLFVDSIEVLYQPSTAVTRFRAYPGTAYPAAFSWDSDSDGTTSPYFYSRVFRDFGHDVSYTDRSSGGNWTLRSVPVAPSVPEPQATVLLALGLGLIGLKRCRRGHGVT